ncbi:MAG: hypothetical protein HY362_01190 [Candidatus Aenigmarchaeota archaeon]|nr:hypothetical protein [Candidatus Aenigmarchaeota archaeon]
MKVVCIIAVLLVLPSFVLAEGNQAVEFKRDYSWQDGGLIGVTQAICSPEGHETPVKCKAGWLNISGATSIIVKARVKIISNTLEGSGWWSDINIGEGEYPVGIYLFYSRSGSSEDGRWRWGFLPGPNPNGLKNYNIVPRGEWGEFTSENIVNYLDKLPEGRPTHIDRILVAGNGWDYVSRADNIELIIDGVNYQLVNSDFSNGKGGWDVEHGSNIQDVYEVNVVSDNSDTAKAAQPAQNLGREVRLPVLNEPGFKLTTTIPTTTTLSSGKIDRIPLSDIERIPITSQSKGAGKGFLEQFFGFFGFLFGK